MRTNFLKLAAVVGITAPTLGSCASACTSAKAITRQEYGSLTSSQKLNFISAVKCVMNKPSALNKIVPATTDLYDDFAAVHVNMTTTIHIDGIFLSWHRHFVYLMEQQLHSCGWPSTSGMPYWNWTLYSDLESSPIFDGSSTSLGGNGLYDPDSEVYVTASGAVLPHGSGGGCVTTGPFANRTVNFQPLDFDTVFTGLPANWTEPDPHCLTRDLNDYGVTNFNNVSDVEYMLAKTTVGDFNEDINGYGDSPGLHGGGHYAIGGSAYDFFSSPVDPAFYLHHSMLDNVWNVWQSVDPVNRRYVYNGTSTIFNADTTPEVTNDTVLYFGPFGSITAKEVQDPLANIYCYKYV
ncbi:hypothetical protein BX600DRAFT_515151 [Xylariales sp. PMI_506]|nr:hypothetical protein BX600DRAFT_515151 [Xylariales sp. PMI_506]